MCWYIKSKEARLEVETLSNRLVGITNYIRLCHKIVASDVALLDAADNILHAVSTRLYAIECELETKLDNEGKE